MKRKSRVLIVIIFVVCIVWVHVAYGKAMKEREANKSECYTTLQELKQLFPNLEGMESATWQAFSLSTDKRVPGPSDTEYKGYIQLSKDKANYYLEHYEWEEAELDMTDDFDKKHCESHTWYLSVEFNEVMIDEKVSGNLYFNGKDLWFDVSRL